MTKLSSAKWCELVGTSVIDPDGWDHNNKNFLSDWENVLIDFDTFYDRWCQSTVRGGGQYTTKEEMYDAALTLLDFQVQRHIEWNGNNPQPPTTFQLSGWNGIGLE